MALDKARNDLRISLADHETTCEHKQSLATTQIELEQWKNKVISEGYQGLLGTIKGY